MKDSVLLYKYPCGCIGLGKPHAPRTIDPIIASRVVWENVMVVKICDADRYDDSDWFLPYPRDLSGFADSRREDPVPVTKMQEEDFFLFMRNTMSDAEKWRQTRSVIRSIFEEADNEPRE